MDQGSIQRRHFLTLLALGTLGAVQRAAADKPDPVCVIVAHNSAQQNLSLGELRRIFLHQPTDDVRGNRFIPLNMPPKTPIRVRFDYTLFGVGADEMARRWVDQRIRGTPPPRVIPTLNTLLQVVAKLPGGISYVYASQLTHDVKPLKVDGLKYNEAKYPLATL